MNIETAIKLAREGEHLGREDMRGVMRQIMTGGAEHDEIVSFLIALRDKGETTDEIIGAAQVMRELSSKVEVDADNLVDTCGTGGDGSGIFNVSTASAIVAAAAGVKVAKHGNRSVSSQCGSADVLETAGVNLDLSPEQVAKCVKKVGVGFMFAPKHHGAMKHAIGPRKEIGTRTIFNVLGPLTNPASAPNQVLGVFSKEMVEPLAEVLRELGSEHVLVVHSMDGLDEISIAADTYYAELKGGVISTGVIKPIDFGLTGLELGGLKVADANESLRLIQAVFGGQTGPSMAIVALNAGAAIYVGGHAESLQAGYELANEVLQNGQALIKLNDYVALTQSFAA